MSTSKGKGKKEQSKVELIQACNSLDQLKAFCGTGLSQDETNAYCKRRRELLAEFVDAEKVAGIVVRTSAAGSSTERTPFRKLVDAVNLPELGKGDAEKFELALTECRSAVAMRNGEADGLLTFGLAYAVGMGYDHDVLAQEVDANCAEWYASRKLEGAAHGSALAVPGTVRAACNPFAVYLKAKGEPEEEIARIYARIERITARAKEIYRERHGLNEEK